MAGLFNTGDSSDFEIHCGGEVFRVHRLILKTRSEYFRAMFDGNGYVENSDGILKLSDVEPAVLKTLLATIYTHHCDVGHLVDLKRFEDRKEEETSYRAELARTELARDTLTAYIAVSDLADRFLCKGIDNILVDEIIDPQPKDNIFYRESFLILTLDFVLYESLVRMFDNAGRGDSHVAQKLITECISDHFYHLRHAGCNEIIEEVLRHPTLATGIARELLLGPVRVMCSGCELIKRFPRPEAGKYEDIGKIVCDCKQTTTVGYGMVLWQEMGY